MNTQVLMDDVVNQVKESQIKLGFSYETVRLYYRVDGLNNRLGTNFQTAKEAAIALREDSLAQQVPFGPLHFAVRQGRVEVSVPPDGVRYVHESVEAPAFLVDIIEFFRHEHHATFEQVEALFVQHGEYVVEQMPEGAEFDYQLHFMDPAIDPSYYCFKGEMGHTIYHRFCKEDYAALL